MRGGSYFCVWGKSWTYPFFVLDLFPVFVPGVALPMPMPEAERIEISAIAAPDSGSTKMSTAIQQRMFFPETWLWDLSARYPSFPHWCFPNQSRNPHVIVLTSQFLVSHISFRGWFPSIFVHVVIVLFSVKCLFQQNTGEKMSNLIKSRCVTSFGSQDLSPQKGTLKGC